MEANEIMNLSSDYLTRVAIQSNIESITKNPNLLLLFLCAIDYIVCAIDCTQLNFATDFACN